MKTFDGVVMGEEEYQLARRVAVNAVGRRIQAADLDDAAQAAAIGMAEAIRNFRVYEGGAPLRAFLITAAKQKVWRHLNIRYQQRLRVANADWLFMEDQDRSFTLWNSEILGTRRSHLLDKNFNDLTDGIGEADKHLLEKLFVEGIAVRKLARENGIPETTLREMRSHAIANAKVNLISRFPDEFHTEVPAPE